MNTTRILTIVFFVISIGLGWFLFSRIKFAIDEEKRITAIELQVQKKLSLIREAEVAYLSVNGVYTDNWDTLSHFMQNGIFYITQKSEQIFTLDYGADSVVVTIDTLGTVSVYDSLFNETKYPGLRFDNLSSIPGSGAKFEIFADEIQKGGVTVDVIEVRDTQPANPARKEDNEARNQQPLRFGSRTDVTTAGNWE